MVLDFTDFIKLSTPGSVSLKVVNKDLMASINFSPLLGLQWLKTLKYKYKEYLLLV